MDARVDLAARLKSATHELHARAERSGVMADLLAGRISRRAYVALLANLHAIYAAMEAAIDATIAREHRPSCFAVLARTAALASDLRAFGVESVPAPLPQALAYVARLRRLRGRQAHRLWAHLYVRSLGDLHGGQVLGRLVREQFAIADSTRFYDFGSSDDVRSLRESLRARLSSLSLDAQREDDVVAEAVWAFEAHIAMFEELRGEELRGDAAAAEEGHR